MSQSDITGIYTPRSSIL